MKRKKVLITGATGFIGGVVYRGLSENYEVISIGRNESCDIKLDLCAVPEDFTLSETDKYYAFIHCAGAIDEEFKLDSVQAWNKTVCGFPKLLEAVRAAGVERLVDISTAHVYGKQEGRISEEIEVNPITDYALAHYVTEQICRRSLIPLLIIRPSTIYGIGAYFKNYTRTGLIPYAFPESIVLQNRIEIKTSGEQKLNFVHVDTVSEIINNFLIQRKIPKFQVINAAGAQHFTVRGYAQLIADQWKEQTGIVSEVICNSGVKIGDPNFEYHSKFTSELGNSVEDDVAEMLNIFRNMERL